MVSKASAAFSRHDKYMFTTDRYFAEELLPTDTLRELDEAKLQLAKAAGVEVTAVDVNIDMHFLLSI